MKTTVISLFAGPGAGKSTTAAKLFVAMKEQGHKVELVQEYVKNWAWEERAITPLDQIYLLAKQMRSESRLYGKVDYIISDSPIQLAAYYDLKHNNSTILSPVISDLLLRSEVDRLNIFVQRDKPYFSHGRYQTEDEAKQVDRELHDMYGYDLEVKTGDIKPILSLL